MQGEPKLGNYLYTISKAQMLIWHLFLQSPNTNLAPIFYKARILIWHLFTKAQRLFLATTHKSPNVDLTPILQSPNTNLALFLQNPNTNLAIISTLFLKPKC